ncbi:30S ribosomal protein S21 [Candidatus Kaiserbacteria bacterium]|nr:30S ribosomal protein S21 [Candidatus Kaiserbacteria bacterium]
MTGSTRVEVRRGKNESSSALIRRFSRRAQGLGLVREMRERRYHERSRSKNVDHKRAMISKLRREKYNELVKLGKIDPAARRTKGPKGKKK